MALEHTYDDLCQRLHEAREYFRGVGLTVTDAEEGADTKALVGKVPDVPTRDELVPTRDGRQIRVRVYHPQDAGPWVLYTHGGGFVVGGLASCDHICRRLAVEDAKAAGIERLIGLPLAPHFADMSLGAYERALASAWEGELIFVRGFHDHPAFISAVEAAQAHEVYVSGETLAVEVVYDGDSAPGDPIRIDGRELRVGVARA